MLIGTTTRPLLHLQFLRQGSGVASVFCQALIKSGARKGQVCGRQVTGIEVKGMPLCKRHVGKSISVGVSLQHLKRAVDDLKRKTQRRVLSAQLFLVNKTTDPHCILLGVHTEQGFFPHRMTGLCASIVNGEDPEDALIRVGAEHGLLLTRDMLERRAMFEFLEADDRDTINEDWLCYAEAKHTYTLSESRAFQPFWAKMDAIPYANMPVDDAVWYPPFIEGKRLTGRFSFDGRMLIGCALWELSEEDWIAELYAKRDFRAMP
eukprot:gnl/MRDRNA2_/MRDRNA2_273079_c0_seq1.p1 gnl/MRDRNA2_/MRDRNA2_273079_c0~~gnl/MRDRNA2_/MRDRNA2_273079_c0_seq1.p1  ORF type:complete len:263 (-),score=24.09 gnl/MRDRNA2_/MRDRNA2_273079_c0_seq1:155-943(-)